MAQCSGERGTLSTRDYNFLTNEFPQVKLLNIPVEKNTKNPDVDLCEKCNHDDENNVNVTATLSDGHKGHVSQGHLRIERNCVE
jgi:hypothetical protein